jgi:prepilin-type N-terminal cleavage/methylation domain-containing protein
MLSKINSKGFTLIELMIVIAIIGILAAIAIPNFIAYRNKAFCSSAESDANAIAAAISDYYAVPNRVNMLTSDAATVARPNGLGLTLSGQNNSTITGSVNNIWIQVLDASSRCPDDYQNSQAPQWDSANNIFTTQM